MKKIVLLVCIVFAAIGTTDAQRRNRQQMDPVQRVEQIMKNLDEKLNLSDEQEQKIKTLYEEFFNQKISREQRKVKKQELDEAVKALLTEEQKEAFGKMDKKKRSNANPE